MAILISDDRIVVTFCILIWRSLTWREMVNCVFFWGCIAANGPYYDTTDMDGLINSTAYTSILHNLLSWTPLSTMMAWIVISSSVFSKTMLRCTILESHKAGLVPTAFYLKQLENDQPKDYTWWTQLNTSDTSWSVGSMHTGLSLPPKIN